MEIALVLVAAVSLVVGVLLGRHSYTWRPQKHTHSSADIIYWLEDDMVTITNLDGGGYRRLNVSFIDEYFRQNGIRIWNGEQGVDSITLISSWP